MNKYLLRDNKNLIAKTVKTFIIAIFFNGCFGLNAQTKISGIVIDEYTSLPIENVKIKVKDLNMGAISDERGFFSITLNKEFPITLISSNLGYDNQIGRASCRERV